MDNPYAPPESELATSNGSAAPLGAGWQPMDVITRSWELFRSQPGVLVASAVIPGIIGVAFGALGQLVVFGGAAVFGEDGMVLANFVSVALSLTSNLVGLFFWLGQVRIALAVTRGDTAELGMLLEGGPHYLTALLASVLMYVGVFVGVCLLIVPGIILSLGLAPYLYVIVDRDTDAVASLKAAWALTDGGKLQIFLWMLIMAVITFGVVLVTCGLGLLVIGPMWSIGMALIYRALSAAQPEPELAF